MPARAIKRSQSRSGSASRLRTDAAPELREFVLLNGRQVVIRPIETRDAGALVEFHEHLSPVSIHNRFFGAHPHLTPLEATSFATIDHHQKMAFVALDDDTVVGVGRYEAIDDHKAAEVAFVVADDLQRQGLGTILLSLLVEHARDNGYTKFVAQLLARNLCMREVFAHSGLSPRFRDHMGITDVVLLLGEEPCGASSSSAPSTQSEGSLSMNNDEGSTSPASQVPTMPGDLGRRVHYWREQAKMTREEVAERAGVSAGYLEYLETAPTGQPPGNALARIAATLGTSVSELLGGNVNRVAGRAPAIRQPHFVSLEPDRSWALLGESGIGRIVFNSMEGPVALPVNYAVSHHDVLLRTDEDGEIARIDAGERVSFEADHIDDAMSKGWSVVVHATCEHLGADCNVGEVFGVHLDPWAGGRRDHWICLRSRSIAGRAIETDP